MLKILKIEIQIHAHSRPSEMTESILEIFNLPIIILTEMSHTSSKLIINCLRKKKEAIY